VTVLTALAVGCATTAPSFVTPTATASAHVTLVPLATPSQHETPDPDSQLVESDEFWAQWLDPIGFELPHDATSLVHAVAQADLIVRGHIQEVYVGEYWRDSADEPPFPLAYALVEVGEVLKGEPESRTPDVVEVQLGRLASESDLERINDLVPDHDNMWFLMYGPNHGTRRLEPQKSAAIAPFEYFLGNEYQGVLREIGGQIRVVGGAELLSDYGPDHYPLPLEGGDFEGLVEEIRSLVD